MSYADVDKILTPWLKRYGLHAYSKHHDGDVRVIHVVDDAGDTYGMSVSEPDESGRLKVYIGSHGSKRKRKNKEYESTLAELEGVLERAYSQIMEWVKQAGHTRTPVL